MASDGDESTHGLVGIMMVTRVQVEFSHTVTWFWAGNHFTSAHLKPKTALVVTFTPLEKNAKVL